MPEENEDQLSPVLDALAAEHGDRELSGEVRRRLAQQSDALKRLAQTFNEVSGVDDTFHTALARGDVNSVIIAVGHLARLATKALEQAVEVVTPLS